MTSSGTSTSTAPSRPGSDFAELTRSVKQRGLLNRRPGNYALKFTVNAVLLGLGWVGFALLGSSWWQLLIAAFLAIVFAQLAFIGHDAGHKQIFRGSRANRVVGYVHGGLVGLSFAWWVGKHNRHHANPNHEDDDPDLDIPLLAFSHGQAAEKRGFQRWTAKYQAFLFFPLLLLEGLSLHLSSIQAVLRREVKATRLEATLLTAHIVGYLTAVFVVLSPLQAIAFIAIHQGLWGIYLGMSFAPNHKGMPMLTAGEKLDHPRKQVLTSRNVRGGRVVDFALGGLNYQIEHHLFPSMPRANLRHAQPLVEQYCSRIGLPYSQTGAFASYAEVLRHLHSIGAPLRAAARVAK
ncbi:fatty acid desaturase [Saccharomonospora marina XMU15]|uniref:Fatty acid desaturase n=1 Tax=Saccharomonospora marina XMU15 TaxID=882083 RepID=H5X4W1_9PSEU|nr:acyl-CoA desaturase [Saccharomonospora marina]EHR52240.1 fatty acid desaturase [Saccharomonospora marina XMU15]